jgi:integrase
VLVLVGFWGHLRLGELLGLERADVDLDEGTVRVKR